MADWPKRAKDFALWARIMQEQALVQDRIQHKSVKGRKAKGRTRRKRFFRKKRRSSAETS